jgi:hypothetical protein
MGSVTLIQVCVACPAISKLTPTFADTMYYLGHAIKLLGNLAPHSVVLKDHYETLKVRVEELSRI